MKSFSCHARVDPHRLEQYPQNSAGDSESTGRLTGDSGKTAESERNNTAERVVLFVVRGCAATPKRAFSPGFSQERWMQVIRIKASALILRDEKILLVEFDDESGVHYNMPGGGVQTGESVIDAVKREAKEEASVDIEVGPLAFVYEYMNSRAPHFHGINLIFDCKLKEGSVPSFPEHPDSNQTGVRWVPFNTLNEIVLYPDLKRHIVEYARNNRTTQIFLPHYSSSSLDKNGGVIYNRKR